MRNFITMCLLIIFSLYFMNCYATSWGLPAYVLVYVDSKGGNYATEYNQEAKKGMACAKSILGLIAVGDASINAAAADGNITKKIISVSKTQEGILGFYQKWCTVVTGF
ncbi:MAG: hypothetical protein KatS3mg129_2158 [Leptospiraceae bacterium]|nr:MAG: hypothetical protein KatS3mg129_2158 [Leptospiraceae bacterium]